MEDKEKTAFWAGILAVPMVFVIIIIVALPILFVNSYIFMSIWNSWIVPTFNQPRLTIYDSAIFNIFIKMFTATSPTSKKETLQESLKKFGGQLLSKLIGLLVIWWLLSLS